MLIKNEFFYDEKELIMYVVGSVQVGNVKKK